jgi:adenine-specific DNA-methyltransferase
MSAPPTLAVAPAAPRAIDVPAGKPKRVSGDFAACLRRWWSERAHQAGVAEAALIAAQQLGLPSEPHAIRIVTQREDALSPYQLGSLYTDGLRAKSRASHGRHYTPELLAEELWTQLRAADASLAAEGQVHDIAAGAGALLVPQLRAAVQQALDGDAEQHPASALAHVAGRFTGRDNDSSAVWLGNILLAAELLPLWAAVPADRRPPLPQLLSVGNGLSSVTTRNITVLNPPYGRVSLGNAQRRRWAHVLSGHANRYALFLTAAVQATSPGGLVGAVIPTSFTGGAYFRRLRSFLAAEAPLHRLVFVSDRSGVFAGVLQETCLAIFRRNRPTAKVRCTSLTVNGDVARVDLGESDVAISGGDEQKPPRTDEPWLLPRTVWDRLLVRRAAELPWRLDDYGWRASTGPLVWNRHKKQIFKDQAQDRVPIVWAADLDDGALRPSRARDGQRYLALRETDAFMVLDEPAVIVQRTTAPEQPRRLLAVSLDAITLKAWGARVVVENHVNVLRCALADSPLTPRVLTALLDSEALDRLYRCMTGSVAVSSYELHALPLPGPRALHRWGTLDHDELTAAVENYYRR